MALTPGTILPRVWLPTQVVSEAEERIEVGIKTLSTKSLTNVVIPTSILSYSPIQHFWDGPMHSSSCPLGNHFLELELKVATRGLLSYISLIYFSPHWLH